MTNYDHTADWQMLRQSIEMSFNIEELRILCFDLRIDYEMFGNLTGKSSQIVSLIEYMVRVGRTGDLLKQLEKTRPHVNWPRNLPRAEHLQFTLPTTYGVYDFQALIKDKTTDFVGREHVFEAITNFIKKRSKGYFIIEGDPGAGKTSILASYAQKTECIAHFNIRPQGINRTNQFLTSITKQLSDRFEFSNLTVPKDPNEQGLFLAKLLEKIGEEIVLSEPLIILIDALDEVNLDDRPSDANVLHLPTSLPDNIYFIMTRRRLRDLPFVTNAPQEIFDLSKYQSRNLEDIYKYLQYRTERTQLSNWIHMQGITSEEFIQILADKSENNFMYLHYILPAIEFGKYQSLHIDDLPVGLRGYYDDHWRRMGMMTKPLPKDKIKIIYILAEVLQPISRSLIAKFSQENEMVVQVVLDEWIQFLHQLIVDKQSYYSFYHTTFREFLYRKEIVQAAGVSLEEINAKIADSILQKSYWL